jgi:hypothetical protein
MGLAWSLERPRRTDLRTGMGMERPGSISAMVLTETPLVLADRYSGVSPLGVLYLSHRVVALMFFQGFSAIRADFS